MNISLPESLHEWVDKQVAEGGYGTVSEFIRQLIREEQLRKERAWVDKKLLEALDSLPIEVTPEYWKEFRREAQERVTAKQAP